MIGPTDLPVIEAAVTVNHGVLGQYLHRRRLDGFLRSAERQNGD
jgi:hypothetical protein